MRERNCHSSKFSNTVTDAVYLPCLADPSNMVFEILSYFSHSPSAFLYSQNGADDPDDVTDTVDVVTDAVGVVVVVVVVDVTGVVEVVVEVKGVLLMSRINPDAIFFCFMVVKLMS